VRGRALSGRLPSFPYIPGGPADRACQAPPRSVRRTGVRGDDPSLRARVSPAGAAQRAGARAASALAAHTAAVPAVIDLGCDAFEAQPGRHGASASA